MILFLDTSALVKLYLSEEGSDALLATARDVSVLAVSRIAWAEAFAAMSRRSREAPEDTDGIELAKRRLRSQWPQYFVVDVTQEVVERAGDLADAFALRGYDSVQLACADAVGQAVDDRICFGCYDARLGKAAKVLGMDTFPGSDPGEVLRS